MEVSSSTLNTEGTWCTHLAELAHSAIAYYGVLESKYMCSNHESK